MPPKKAVASLSGLIEDEEDMENSEVDAMPTPESNQENAQPVKKRVGRTKAAANKFTKTRPPPRRASGGMAAAVIKKKAPPKRKAMSKRTPSNEQANHQHASDSYGVEDLDTQMQQKPIERDSADELVAAKQPAKRGRKPATRAKPLAEPEVPQQVRNTEKDGEFEYTPTIIRQSKLLNKATSAAQGPSIGKRQRSIEPRQIQDIIPETQESPMDLDTSCLPDEDFDSALPQSVFRPTSNVTVNSRHRQTSVARRRAGSVSDVERSGNDPATRRRLGDMTKKFENLESRYRNLREVGVQEAESKMDKLKAVSEAKEKAANDLIASLKKELATQKALAQESKVLQKQVVTKDLNVTKAQALATELSTSLSEAQNENKALQAKLANARSASSAVESVHAKTPGSIIKGRGQDRTIMVGSHEAAQSAQVARLKEDLYSDLTGLILRGVERGGDCDVYDCIQTGRNGNGIAALHFKLAVVNEGDSRNASYEDTEFSYTPRLDSNRDRDLLGLLPDYLREEITFSRMNAAMFYGRVVETLTKKRVEE